MFGTEIETILIYFSNLKPMVLHKNYETPKNWRIFFKNT
jgi:hypothetical protein